MRWTIIFRQWHFIPKCYPFADAALFLKSYGNPLEFQALFLGVPSAKWWTQLIKKNAQFFHIRYLKNLLEKELVSRIYTTKKEDWTSPIGIPHVSIKLSSTLMEHSFFDPRFDINSAYQNSGCKLKSTLHMVQDYCLSFGRKMQFSKNNAASCQGFLRDL